MNFITRKAVFCLPEGVAMAHISYTMSTLGLPDMYTLSPLACGPQALGVHIRQTTRVHGISITCTVYAEIFTVCIFCGWPID